MEPAPHAFPANARAALADAGLQQALRRVEAGFIRKRAAAISGLPEFDALRDEAAAIRAHVLDHLDLYLERFAAAVEGRGGQVHWCASAEEARAAILAICRAAGARSVTKGKSMVAEEIGINAHLAAHGIAPVETDLGEYIIQLAEEPPSHIIAPAIHKTRGQVTELFRRHHQSLDPDRPLELGEDLVAEARRVLRPRYFAAEVGITGANFLVAETGSAVLVTNEGNGDLTRLLPRVHVVIAGIEKVVPTLTDATTLLRVLARSATGQEMSVYTSVMTGPRRPEDGDGPEEFHVVLLDNGRSRLLGGEFRDILRCIRCGACLNHCPVYAAVGGHAYGSVYMGPMGAVLTPNLAGIKESYHLPNASTLCGRCGEVCPVRIPLPMLLRGWREVAFAAAAPPARERLALRLWAWAARRPRLYHALAPLGSGLLARLGRRRGRFRRLPFAGGWTAGRDLPAPEGGTFQARWRAGEGRRDNG